MSSAKGQTLPAETGFPGFKRMLDFSAKTGDAVLNLGEQGGLKSVLGNNLLPIDIRESYQVEERHHACSILKEDFPEQWKDLIEVLRSFKLRKTDMEKPGGNKSPIAKGLNGLFFKRGWVEKSFDIKVIADGNETLAPTHHVDYYKSGVAVETEWNNKDPFFDRDLTTFRLLFELNVLSVGVIITRADELQSLFTTLGKKTAAGAATTHMSKLIPKMHNRASGGCPVLALGITKKKYDAHA